MCVIKARTACEHPKNKPCGQCGLYSHFSSVRLQIPPASSASCGSGPRLRLPCGRKKHEEKNNPPHKPLTSTITTFQCFSFQHQANKTVLTLTLPGKPWVVVVVGGGGGCILLFYYSISVQLSVSCETCRMLCILSGHVIREISMSCELWPILDGSRVRPG